MPLLVIRFKEKDVPQTKLSLGLERPVTRVLDNYEMEAKECPTFTPIIGNYEADSV